MTPQDAYAFILGEWQDLDVWCMRHQCDAQVDLHAVLFSAQRATVPKWQKLNADDYPIRTPIGMIFSDAEQKTPPVKRLIIVHKRVDTDGDWAGFHCFGAEPDLAAKDHTEMLANIRLAASPMLDILQARYPMHVPWYCRRLGKLPGYGPPIRS